MIIIWLTLLNIVTSAMLKETKRDIPPASAFSPSFSWDGREGGREAETGREAGREGDVHAESACEYG